MSFRWAVSALVIFIAVGASQAAADTSTTTNPRDPVGPHHIVRLVVDNTGSDIGATVVHRSSAWKGRVELSFDVSGDAAPEYGAIIWHGRPSPAKFSQAGDRPWPCASRTARSGAAERNTTLSVGRSCFAGGATVSVTAKVFAGGRQRGVLASGQVRQQTRPNVVMIIVDDMRDDDLRYMPLARRLIGGEGVRFANSFSPYPLCCPARASIFLGQYTHNHRVFSVKAPYAFPALKDRSTLATWLQDAGYSTVLLGKYMNGYGYLPKPGAKKGKSLDYVPPGWTDWRASIEGGIPAGHPDFGGTYSYFNTTLSDHGRGFSNYSGRYQTRVYGDLSEQIIRTRAASDKPFFLYASYTAPHNGGPTESDDLKWVERDDGTLAKFGSPARPDDVKGLFDDVIAAAPGADWRDPDINDKPEYLRSVLPINEAERAAMLELTRQRAEALHVVDAQVKRTIDALAASGELEETLVIFTSDNGYYLGEQRIRQGKIMPHEPSLRTPLLMRGPRLPAGEVRYDPFMSIDFAPTIANLAGAEPGVPVDGVTMLNVARHGDRGWRRAVLTETGARGVVRQTDEAGQPLDVEDPGEPDTRWAIGIRTDRFLYVDLASNEEELYDLATDPDQYHNLASDPSHAETRSLMREQLARMRACDAAQCRAPLPEELATSPGQSIQRSADARARASSPRG